jgi:hypothetical protein
MNGAAGVVNAKNPLYRARKRTNILLLTVSAFALLFGLFWLVWILGTLLYEGGYALSRAALYFQMTPPPGADGGLANAIVGSLIICFVGTLIGTPVGILAGTYLAEFGKRSWLASATRFLNDVLLSAPSIVIGLFVYSVYVARVGHFSGWAGSFALALIAIAGPLISRGYEVEIIGLARGAFRTSSGLRVYADRGIADAAPAIDTPLVSTSGWLRTGTGLPLSRSSKLAPLRWSTRLSALPSAGDVNSNCWSTVMLALNSEVLPPPGPLSVAVATILSPRATLATGVKVAVLTAPASAAR